MLIGNNICNLRKKLKLSQEKLAEKVNVTRQTISNWETEQTIPDLYQTKKLAVALNVTVAELLDENLSNDIIDEDIIICEKFKMKIKEVVSLFAYETWFKEIIKIKINKDELILFVELNLIGRYIMDNYNQEVLDIFNNDFNIKVKKISYIVE